MSKKTESSFSVVMSLGDLVITEQRLGEGGFGSVFVGQLDEKKVAAKKLSQSEKEFNNLVREASKLKRLRYGKHIAYIYGITMKNENLYMVMEYCELGDLQNYLERNKESTTYEQKIPFCRGILLGLLYCHSMKIFHGDIKCSNVVLDKKLEPKLADFGLSMTVDNIEYYSKLYKGSLYWTAPELFSIKDVETVYQEFIANPYPCDVYSLGATFCEISYGGTTEFIDSDDPITDIMLGLVSPMPKDAFLKEIVDRCCQFERKERISPDECLSMLDIVIEEKLLVPTVNEKWLRMQQDIQANSKLELPPSFILHRPAQNLVVGPSNLSLLEWLCINNYVDAVKYMIQLREYDQDQIKWLCKISEVCKSQEVVTFLQGLMQNREFSHLRLSNIIDNHPQQFFEILVKAGASCSSYSLLKRAIERHHNMTVQAIIDSKSHFKDWAIHDAVKFGNAEAVKILVDIGADLECKDYYTGNTPLMTAINAENAEVVKILLKFGADVYSKSSYAQSGVKAEIPYKPLYLAALKGNREIVKLLIDAGATMNIRNSEWHSLSQNLEQQGNVSMVHFISNSISKKLSPVKESSLCTAIQNKQLDLVQTLIDNRATVDEIGLDGYAPLHWAVIVGNEEITRILIMAGADLDIRTSNEEQGFDSFSRPGYFSKCTPLHIAISEGHLGIVKLLVESGADFSARNGLQQTVIDIAKEDKKVLEEIIRGYAPANAISIRRAIESMSPESTKLMINKQVNAEILSECLCIAASRGRNDLVKYLLEREVSINKRYQNRTSLEWAAFGRNIQVMKILINANADINAKNTHMKALLFQYVWESQVDMVQFLVSNGADANSRNENGNAPIYYANDAEIMEILINTGADINTKNKCGEAPLIWHAKHSNMEIVRLLVGKGANVNTKDKDGNTLVHYVNDKEIMKILINAGADVNAKSKYGVTPLIQYVSESNTEIVQFLVDKKADVNVRDENGCAPIHYANDKEIMELLINANTDINAKNKYEVTPLIQFVIKLNTEMVQFLVNKGANVNTRDKNGNASIHYANDKKVMELLINAGADVNAKNKYGRTPLIRRVRESNTEMVQFLINKGADINVRDENGYAAICYTDNKNIVKILINAGADVSIKDQYGRTHLIRFVRESSTEVVQFLVNKGADVNARDGDGDASIHYANDKKIMELLINAGADVNAKSKYGVTPLIQCVKESNTEMVQFLVDKGADVNVRDRDENASIHYVKSKEIMKILINAGADINAKNQYGRTPLIWFVRESNSEMVQFLVDKGVDVNVRDKNRDIPAHYVKNNEIMKILINAGADVNTKNQYVTALLIQSIKESNIERIQFLVNKGVDVNARDKDGNIPTHYVKSKEIMKVLINAGADVNTKNQYVTALLIQSIKESNTEIVQFLVDKGVDFKTRDKDGNTLVHYANDKEIMEILINAGADVNTKSKYGVTPLIQSVMKSNTEMIQFLLDKQADLNAVNKYGYAPIHYVNNMETMRILVNAGADVNTKNKYGTTPLIQHVRDSNTEIIHFLLDKGANTNAVNKYGNAPICYANDKEVMKILINAGADGNTKNKYGVTPLIQYVKESNTEMVQFLVDKKADVNVRDEDGYAAIRYVNDKEIMKILVNAGADINAKNQYKRIHLIQYVKESNTEMIQFLVDKGADVNARDEDGNAPIHYANDKKIMKILVNAGANANAKNQDGRTHLIQYVKESNTEMVQFLVDKGADVNARDEDGNAPIHYANDKEIMKIFINAGADINAKNQYGKTSLIQYIKDSNTEMVQFLVGKGADVNARDEDGNMPICYANDKEVMKILVNAGADVNTKNKYGVIHLIQLVKESNTEMVQFLVDKGADVNVRDENGYTAICYTNDKDIAKILINAGADINARNQDGRTHLIQFARESNTEMVRFLVDKRADVNARDEDGNAPIHYANDKKIMKILINAGANANAKNQDGRTHLIQYVKESNTEMVRFLVNKRADVNARDEDGNAPIHYANDKEITKILINAGADVNAKNQYGETSLIQYIKDSDIEIVQFLIDKGADINARDEDENAPVHFIRDKRIAEILVNAGANINVKDIYGKELFYILIEEQNMNLSNNQYKRKKICELLEYLRIKI